MSITSKYKYDFLIVGAGLYGCVFARQAADKGKRCLVVEQRKHIGGNCFTYNEHGIEVHAYGPHIFHTSDEQVWEYVNRFASFNNYINSPIANYHGRLYNLPFNMNTFCKLWDDVLTPDDARRKIESQRQLCQLDHEPRNLEEKALSMVGLDIYNLLIKGYSEKQWGMNATNIAAEVITRLPLRFTFDNNYFNDKYQGIPTCGYTAMLERMLSGIEVVTGLDYADIPARELLNLAEKTIYTGSIDRYFNYRYGHLAFRSLRFDHKFMPDCDNVQGVAVMNFTDSDTPFTRIVEHKHFTGNTSKGSVITHEYPMTGNADTHHEPCTDNNGVINIVPCYPISTTTNLQILDKYKALAASESNICFCGRMGQYKYYDMDKVVASALSHPWLNEA